MIEKLVAGVSHFTKAVFPKSADHFADLVDGQAPHFLFITCSDSRIDPALITQTQPGDMFVVRNAGNIVPRLDETGGSSDGTAASIEFAITALGVSDIVVCGHSSCGAMQSLQDPSSLDGLPIVRRWLQHSSELIPSGQDSSSLPSLIEQNVLLQLEHLRTYPGVERAIADGALRLHGWVYDIGSGVVQHHDGEQFEPALHTH